MGSSKMCAWAPLAMSWTSVSFPGEILPKMEIKNKKFEKEFIWRVSIARSEGEKI
jgi:hypothetical protein